ncbi:MAG TPA: dNTP triphosphohydrolase, partial [Phototrophicaceae bacterium]|nr:dNTP triphosphohydrolase [Phototrophicaceae bacterium]
ESDFFRNRLTHSLEVAQIAKSIAIRLNATSKYFSALQNKIDTDLVELSALAHDLGHPPFGHNGEAALDECMRDHGGFEGNAQTFRILSRLEKKDTKRLVDGTVAPLDGAEDVRCGLNLTYRSLASVLKYDKEIPKRAADRTPGKKAKGYYHDDRQLVSDIKKNVVGDGDVKSFRTIECSIMDVADDIAYSTYDLEDNFKAGFLEPLDLFNIDDELAEKIAKTTASRIEEFFPELPVSRRSFGPDDVLYVLFDVFKDPLFTLGSDEIEVIRRRDMMQEAKKMLLSIFSAEVARKMASNGYERVKFTSRLVQEFVQGVELIPHPRFPQLHRVRLKLEVFKKVEVLKNMTFEAIIMASKMQVVEYRGKDIIMAIFKAIDSENGSRLLPEDYRSLFNALSGSERKRVICDFIAGMTDRYANEFYSRLYGAAGPTIYKPL